MLPGHENVSEGFIVSVDIRNNGDNAILIVGVKKKQKVEIVNAFSGQEAIDLYHKLTTPVVKEEKA